MPSKSKNTVTAEIVRVRSPLAAGTIDRPYALALEDIGVVVPLTGEQAASLLGIEPTAADKDRDLLRPREQHEIAARARYNAENEPEYLRQLAEMIPDVDD